MADDSYFSATASDGRTVLAQVDELADPASPEAFAELSGTESTPITFVVTRAAPIGALADEAHFRVHTERDSELGRLDRAS